jgi:hypothetical protein
MKPEAVLAGVPTTNGSNTAPSPTKATAINNTSPTILYNRPHCACVRRVI